MRKTYRIDIRIDQREWKLELRTADKVEVREAIGRITDQYPAYRAKMITIEAEGDVNRWFRTNIDRWIAAPGWVRVVTYLAFGLAVGTAWNVWS